MVYPRLRRQSTAEMSFRPRCAPGGFSIARSTFESWAVHFRTKQTKALIRDIIRRIEAYLPRSIRRGRQKSLEASVVVVLIIKASLGKGTHKILSNGRRCGVLGTNRV